MKYCVEHAPDGTIQISVVCGGENCALAQEMAFMLSEVIELIECGGKAGINPDDIILGLVPRCMGMDFFEEICKLRAFRKMWAKTIKEVWM